MKRILLMITIVLLWAVPGNAMLCLDNTDTLEGGASVDAVVDYTVHGLNVATFANLAQGQLSDTDPSVLYTATAGTSVVSIVFVNTHSAAVTVNLYLDPANAGTPRRLIPKDLSLGIGYSMVFDGQRCTVMDASGGIQGSFVAHAVTHKAGGTDDLLSAPGAIGGTTPATGAFTTIAASGNVTQADALYIATDEIRARDSGGLKLYEDGGAGIFVQDSTGNVGIGMTNPAAKLDVNGWTAFRLALLLRDNGTGNSVAQLREIGGGQTGLKITNGSNTAEWMRFTSSGNVGIGTTSPNQLLTVEGSMSLKEIADAAADTAAYGQIWVHNTGPNELWFTDDAGTDTQISPHPLDAPPTLYTNGPGLDWMGKRVQKYLGVIFWQSLDGTITEETFDAYNLRRKDVEGHTDLVKLDWDTIQLAKLKADKLKEIVETEVAPAEAFESVEITEDVQTGTKADGYEYAVDVEGKVSIIAKTAPVMTKQGTGKFEKRLKSEVSFDAETGKFIRKHKMTEAEVDALGLTAPEMPGWIKTWVDNKAE